MQKIEFIKMHGLGNDFVIIDKRFKKIDISKELINNISDRRSGAGCDQLITINQNTSKNHDISIEIYNPNGDRAEACGNGTRCIAKLLFDETSRSELKIKSDAGILTAKKIDNENISINLGKLSHNWQDIPLIKNVDTLNMPIDINVNGIERRIVPTKDVQEIEISEYSVIHIRDWEFLMLLEENSDLIKKEAS